MPKVRQASRPIDMFTGDARPRIRHSAPNKKPVRLLGSHQQCLAKRNSDAAYVVVNRAKSKHIRRSQRFRRRLWSFSPVLGQTASMTESKNRHIARVYGARSNEDLEQGYDGWAGDYDGDMERRGYRLPGVVTALVARHVAPDAGPILDAGAGSGLLGEWLQLAGYRDITGIDLSAGMLEQARRTGAYRVLHRMTLGESLDLPDGSFAAVASAGSFGITHAPASGFDELIRITRPGGHLVISIRDKGIAEAGFPQAIARLEQAGRWGLVETAGPFPAMRGEPESLYVVHVFRKTP